MRRVSGQRLVGRGGVRRVLHSQVLWRLGRAPQFQGAIVWRLHEESAGRAVARAGRDAALGLADAEGKQAAERRVRGEVAVRVPALEADSRFPGTSPDIRTARRHKSASVECSSRATWGSGCVPGSLHLGLPKESGPAAHQGWQG